MKIPEIIQLDLYNCTFKYNDNIYTAVFELSFECYEGEVEIYAIYEDSDKKQENNLIESLPIELSCQLESYIEQYGDRWCWISDHENKL